MGLDLRVPQENQAFPGFKVSAVEVKEKGDTAIIHGEISHPRWTAHLLLLSVKKAAMAVQ